MAKTLDKKQIKTKKTFIKKKPIVSPSYLLDSFQPKSGRSQGKISVRRRSGGVKRKYRIIDLKRKKMGVPAKVVKIEYDPNRTANIALIKYQDGEWSYILAPENLKIGSRIETGENVPITSGNRTLLKNIPLGTEVYNIELIPGKGGQIVRAAGSSATLLAKDGRYFHLRLPSGEIRKILEECQASIGKVSNSEHSTYTISKAGVLKYRGRRPRVRGKAMAPNAHPHGGGEGVNPIGLIHPKTPWGKPTMGYKTRKKKTSDKMIVRRRK